MKVLPNMTKQPELQIGSSYFSLGPAQGAVDGAFGIQFSERRNMDENLIISK